MYRLLQTRKTHLSFSAQNFGGAGSHTAHMTEFYSPALLEVKPVAHVPKYLSQITLLDFPVAKGPSKQKHSYQT